MIDHDSERLGRLRTIFPGNWSPPTPKISIVVKVDTGQDVVVVIAVRAIIAIRKGEAQRLPLR